MLSRRLRVAAECSYTKTAVDISAKAFREVRQFICGGARIRKRPSRDCQSRELGIQFFRSTSSEPARSLLQRERGPSEWDLKHR